MADKTVQVDLTLDKKGFSSGLTGAGQDMDSFSKKGGLMGANTLDTMKSVGKAAAEGAAVVGAALLAGGTALLGIETKAASYAKEINLASKTTGLTVEQIERLKFAAEKSGIGLDSITNATKFLAKSMEAAKTGTGKQAEVFKELGITATNADGSLRGTNDVMMQVADAMVRTTNPAERLIIATTLFGKAGAEMIPMLLKGSAGINALGDEASKFGLILDASGIAKLLGFAAASGRVKDALVGLDLFIAESASPALTGLSTVLSDAIIKLRESGDLEKVFNGIGSALEWVVPKIVTLIDNLSHAGDAAKVVANDVQRAFLDMELIVIKTIGGIADIAEHIPGLGGWARGVKFDASQAMLAMNNELMELDLAAAVANGTWDAVNAEVVTSMTLMGPAAVAKMAAAMNQVALATASGKQGIATAMAGNMTGLITALASGMPGAKSNMTGLTRELANVITDANFYTATTEQMHQLAQGISDSTHVPITTVLALMNTLRGEVNNTDLKGAMDNAMNPIPGQVLAYKPIILADAIAVGGAAGEGLTGGMLSYGANVWAAGAQLHANAIGGAGSLYPEGSSIGHGFGQGIAQGIGSMVNGVVSSINSMISAAKAAAAAATGAHSPWPLTLELGRGFADGLTEGIKSQAPFAISAASGLIDKLGGSMTGGSSLQANITALDAAWAALSSTALVGWSKDTDNAAAGFAKMEEAIMNLGGAMAGPQLAAWRNMRAEYDKANAALAEYQKQLDASDVSLNKLQHSEELLNRSLTAHNDALSKLSSMKLAGEGAASDASFAKEHEINRLQLEILKAQKEGRFNDAAKMARDKLKLEAEKAILDAQTTYDYEAQKRGLEKLLDPLKGQEMTYTNIVTQINAEQKAIASKQLALGKIERQIIKEQDAQWKLKGLYDASNKVVQIYSAQVDKMAANFLKHYDEMAAAAAALNKTVASSPNKALAIYEKQMMAMAREHKSRYLDMIGSARSLNQAVAMGAFSGGLAASNTPAASASSTTTTTTHNFFVDKLVLNGVQDVPTLKTELMNARLRMATP